MMEWIRESRHAGSLGSDGKGWKFGVQFPILDSVSKLWRVSCTDMHLISCNNKTQNIKTRINQFNLNKTKPNKTKPKKKKKFLKKRNTLTNSITCNWKGAYLKVDLSLEAKWIKGPYTYPHPFPLPFSPTTITTTTTTTTKKKKKRRKWVAAGKMPGVCDIPQKSPDFFFLLILLLLHKMCADMYFAVCKN